MAHLLDRLLEAITENEQDERRESVKNSVEWQLKHSHLIVHYEAITNILDPHKEGYQVHEVYTKLFPLYTSVFIETQLSFDNQRPHACGVLLNATKFDKDNPEWKDGTEGFKWLRQIAIDSDNVSWIYNAEVFVEADNTRLDFATGIVFIGQEGEILPATHPVNKTPVSFALIPHEVTFKAMQMRLKQGGREVISELEFTELANVVLEAGLYTVDFIHRHKNIALEQINPTMKNNQRRAREKKGLLPLKTYHVIKITTGRGAGEYIGRRGGLRNKSRFHGVRGHTREYINGLFGNPALAGEYYIPPFVRGAKEKGNIKKHYHVASKEQGGKEQGESNGS